MKTVPVEISWLHKANMNTVFFSGETIHPSHLVNKISSDWNLSSDDFYLVQNGRLLGRDDNVADGCPVRVILKALGGKGGFGSMLRAIGAQIEKTTNREACRDLSGRRLRDINEEKRLKNLISQQADRERQEADKLQRKLKKLRAEPKHEFSDKQYEEERSQLIENVHDAVEHGFSSLLPSVSSEPSTSKVAESKSTGKKKPKKKGFMFEDEEFSLSESDEETSSRVNSSPTKRLLESNGSGECPPHKKQKLSSRHDTEEVKEPCKNSDCPSPKKQETTSTPDTEEVKEPCENSDCPSLKKQETTSTPGTEEVKVKEPCEDSEYSSTKEQTISISDEKEVKSIE